MATCTRCGQRPAWALGGCRSCLLTPLGQKDPEDRDDDEPEEAET